MLEINKEIEKLEKQLECTLKRISMLKSSNYQLQRQLQSIIYIKLVGTME